GDSALVEELQERVLSVRRGGDGNSVPGEILGDVAEPDAGQQVALGDVLGRGPDVDSREVAGLGADVPRGRMEDRGKPGAELDATELEGEGYDHGGDGGDQQRGAQTGTPGHQQDR